MDVSNANIMSDRELLDRYEKCDHDWWHEATGMVITTMPPMVMVQCRKCKAGARQNLLTGDTENHNHRGCDHFWREAVKDDDPPHHYHFCHICGDTREVPEPEKE